MSHRNAPLSYEGRLRLVRALPAPTDRARGRRDGNLPGVRVEVGQPLAPARRARPARPVLDPAHQPERDPGVGDREDRDLAAGEEVVRAADHPRAGRASATRINRRTVTRHLTRLGLGQRRFLDPSGDSNRKPGKITARWPGHMVHLDVKKVGRIPDGGGWRIHGRDSDQHRAVDRAKTAGANARLRLPALHRRRVLPARLHRAARRREGRHRGRVPGPGEGLVRRPRHHPHPPGRHRQRRLLPLERLRPDRRQQHPAPEDQAVHPAPQRQGGALPADPRRGSSSTPASTAARTSAQPPSPSGTSTTTTIDPTAPRAADRQHLDSTPASPTSGPHTPRRRRRLTSEARTRTGDTAPPTRRKTDTWVRVHCGHHPLTSPWVPSSQVTLTVTGIGSLS